MKKILYVCILSAFVIVLTGCDFGKKGTITCTYEPSNELVDTVGEMPKQEIIIKYRGKKIKSATGSYIYSSAEVAKANYDDLMAVSKENEVTKDYKLEGNKITNVVNKNDVIELAIGNSTNKNDKSKDNIIASLRAQNYVCN